MPSETSVLPSRPSRPSRAVVWVAVFAVVVGAFAGLAYWRLHDDRPRAEVGANVAPPAATDRIIGLSSELPLPSGNHRVALSEALEELPPRCCLDEPADPRAPEDGSFVGIEVTLEIGASREPVAEPGTTMPVPTLTLVVEESGLEPETTDYPVTVEPEAWERNNLVNNPIRTYVAVEGRPTIADLQLRVDYDGVSQLVHPDRDFVEAEEARRVLPSDSAPVPQSCGEFRPPIGFSVDRDSEPTCTLGVERVSYVGGLGWAPSGQRWLVVTPYVSRYISADRRVGSQRFGYDSGDQTPDVGVAIDGEAPVKSWRDRSDNLVSVFREPELGGGREVVSVTYRGLSAADEAPRLDELTVTWRGGE